MMHIIIEWANKKYSADLQKPIDISIPLQSGGNNPNAFGISAPHFEPFKAGPFIGSVNLGGSVNCENLLINPHGNGTHTECVGHISKERITINSSLKEFFTLAQVVSVSPGSNNLISSNEIASILTSDIESLIIRTLPNDDNKLTKNYSGNNPAALDPGLCKYLAEKGIKHLLVDLPSVDPEEDDGLLKAHHAYWNYPSNPRMNATITEMIYVNNSIADGIYLLNLQIASIESDASPSKPLLYKLDNVL